MERKKIRVSPQKDKLGEIRKIMLFTSPPINRARVLSINYLIRTYFNKEIFIHVD
jgi:hypothetical protein